MGFVFVRRSARGSPARRGLSPVLPLAPVKGCLQLVCLVFGRSPPGADRRYPILARRSRRLLPTTLMELNAIARAAATGCNSRT